MFGRGISNFISNSLTRTRLRSAFITASFCSLTIVGDVQANADGASSAPFQALDTQEVTALEPGRPVERELGSWQSHRYQIRLVQGQHALVSLEQRGIDVTVELLGADDGLIADFDGEIRNQGKEEIDFESETTGSYTLVVKAKLKGVPAGSYEIRFIEARAATDNDRTLQETRKLRAQAGRLTGLGKYDEAVPLVERAVAIAEKLLGADHLYVAQSVRQLAGLYFAKNDFAKAKPLFERALAVLEKELGPEHPQTADAMRALGAVYANAGEYPKADQLLSRALEIAEKTLGIEHPLVGHCLMDLGPVYASRGEFEKGEEFSRRSLMILEKTGTEDLNFAFLLNNLSYFHNRRRDYEGAVQLLHRCLAIEERILGPEHLQLATTLQNLGINASAAKDNATALQYYLRALAIREKAQGTQHPDVAWALNNIANSYRRKGDYPKAVETHLRAVKILENTAGPYQDVTLLTLGGIARDYSAMGDVANAIKFQSRVDAVIEANMTLNLAFGSERQKVAFLNTLSGRTDRTISLNIQLAPGDPNASALAALVLLQRKGRVLDAMTDTLGALLRRADPQDRILLDQLNETRSRLSRLVLSGPQKMLPEEHQRIVKDLEEKREKLEAEISLHSGEFRAQTQPVTLEAVQAAIPAGAALVEFAAYRPFNPKAEIDSEDFGETRYVAYVVHTHGDVKGIDLGEAKAIDTVIDAFRKALHDPLRRDVRDLARSLDEKVMQPVRGMIGDINQLLISPDGALNLIPFEALVDEHGRFLIQRFSFAYLTSGRDLLRMQVARESKSKPLVVANPLFGEPASELLAKTDAPTKQTAPASGRRSVTTGRDLAEVYFAPLGGTAEEARSIETLFPEASLLTGDQATESAIKQTAAPRILHIATHGFFLQDAETAGGRSAQGATRGINTSARIENPLLRSGLALAGANLRGGGGDDGILTALEAAGLNLWGTKLVTLSACDTGLGEVRNGEGVYGLRRAFVLAGTETLVMSLWPVSDYVTREMMTAYYKGLKQGRGRGEALRQVQLSMLKRKDRQHPFYWASFIQSGEWANLDGKR